MSKGNESTEMVSTAEEIDSGELVPIPRGSLLPILSGQAPIEMVRLDSAEVARRLAAEAMKAETEEDLTRQAVTFSSKGLVGEVVEIVGLRGVYPSRFEDAESGENGQFVSWGAVRLLTGEIGILNTSSGRINATLGWHYDHGTLPARFEIVVRTQSTGGFDVLDVDKVQ